MRSVSQFRLEITSQVQDVLQEWYDCKFRGKLITTETYEHGTGVRIR